MGKKIIFLDIDGTLCQPGSNVPPASALEAIKKARSAGNLVFLCTGRNLGMLKPLLQFGFDGVVGSSGGYITCGNTVIYDCPMTAGQQKTAMEVLEKNGVFRTVECRDRSYTDEGFKEFLREKAQRESNSEVLRWREQIEKDLETLSAEKAELETALSAGNLPFDQLQAASERIGEIMEETDEKEMRWLELTDGL